MPGKKILKTRAAAPVSEGEIVHNWWRDSFLSVFLGFVLDRSGYPCPENPYPTCLC